jgi:protein-disulfide isomerase
MFFAKDDQMQVALVLWLFLAGVDGQQALVPASSSETKVVARIGDVAITQKDLEDGAAADLLELGLKRQQVLEQVLNRLVTNKLIGLEAAARKLRETELLRQEVDSKVADPTEAEVSLVYESNKDRIPDPKDKAIERVKQSMIQQRKQKLYLELVDALKKKYQVSVLLEPFRVTIPVEGYPSLGPAKAPVTIVEFTDLECPYCLQMNTALKQIRRDYENSVRLVLHPFPLAQLHPNSIKAAEACYCAADQGKFWEYRNKVFEDQKNMSVLSLSMKAGDMGLDVKEFERCLSTGKHAGRIKADIEAGQALGVNSTPTLFINGRPLKGALPVQEILKVIEEELARIK